MNEPVIPEEQPHEHPEHVETPTERVMDMAAEFRRRAEDLSNVAQERARELGGTIGEKTNEAVGQIRYFSEHAREEAAARLERTSHYFTRQMDEATDYTREAVRQHPGVSLALAALAGFMFAMFSRRFIAGMWRR